MGCTPNLNPLELETYSKTPMESNFGDKLVKTNNKQKVAH